MSHTPNFDVALDKIFADLKPHTRTCPETGESFEITERDIKMLKLLRVPPPQTTWWARTRQKRTFLAGFAFFRRTLPDGQSVVTMFDPESPATIISREDWQGDDFDPLTFGIDVRVDQSFFDQFRKFSFQVPRPAIFQDARSVNCEWTIYPFNSKNCYFTLGGIENEDVLYADMSIHCKHCADLSRADDCNFCHSVVSTKNSSRVFFSNSCENCINVCFSLNCRNCTDCFGCTNLRNKKFCFLNEQLTESEYRTRLEAIDLGDAKTVEEWQKRIVDQVWVKAFRPANKNLRSENARGDDIEDCRDVEGCTINKSERCYYGFGMVSDGKDCVDFMSSSFVERCYNFVRTFHCADCRMTLACDGCIDVEYSELLTNCEHCFGCIGLKNKKFCIFNKQYAEEEYWPLVDAIKTAMLERGEYGEFFPHDASLFAYNSSHALLIFPATENEARALGSRWCSYEQEKNTEARSIDDLPYGLNDAKDDVLKKKYRCPVSGRAFGFTKLELALHRDFGVALPRVHPTVRQQVFAEQLFPMRLYRRTCDSCGAPVDTRIPASYPARILCQKCYEAVVVDEKSLA